MEIKISDIKIGERFRKDLGDINGLASSIKEIGLLQPVAINENNELIAGQRRIEAAKRLGWTKIPVTVVNIEDIIEGEFQENAVRKEFTTSERIAILEEIERRRIGHKTNGKGGNLPPFQEQNKGKKSRDIAAKYFGTSPRQLQKEKKIVEAARKWPEKFEGILKKVDSRKMSVACAHMMANRTERQKQLEEEAEERRKSLKFIGQDGYNPIYSNDILSKIVIDGHGTIRYLDTERNDNEYRSDDGNIRIIQGNPSKVSPIETSSSIDHKVYEYGQTWNSIEIPRDGIPNNSVDLIYIDYDTVLKLERKLSNINRDYIYDLERLAERILKPDGILAIVVQPKYDVINKATYGNGIKTFVPIVYTNGNCGEYYTAKWKILLLRNFTGSVWDLVKLKMEDNVIVVTSSDNNNSELEYIFRQLISLLPPQPTPTDITIFDPLMGVENVAMTALTLGMKYIGIEEDPKLFETVKSKIENKTQKKLEKVEGNIINIDENIQLTDEDRKPLIPTVIRADIHDCFKIHKQVVQERAAIDSQAKQNI